MDGKDFRSGLLDAMIKGHTEVLSMIVSKLLKTT
jgi:hypothetical protein